MAGKRKPSSPRVTDPKERLSPPVDWKGRPPMIVTLGEDLEKSKRLQAQLAELRKLYEQGDLISQCEQ